MRRFRSWLALMCVLLGVGVLTAGSVCAQSDADFEALNQRVIELCRTGKCTEAIPLAERYAEVMKARYGSDHPNYARALHNLAALLPSDRLAEAEALMRRALAIEEKNVGPEHPNVAFRLVLLAERLPADRLADAEAPWRSSRSLLDQIIRSWPHASTIWPCCSRTPTGWSRPRC